MDCALRHDRVVLLFLLSERVLKLMDFEEGSFQDFTGHHDSVSHVIFSPCGTMLAAACSSTIHIWNIAVQ